MSTKIRTTIIGTVAASVLAVTAIPAAALAPHNPSPHGGWGGGGCDIPIKPPQVCP